MIKRFSPELLLSLLKTPDALSDAYQKKHNRDLSQNKTSEIIANIMQGDAYIESVETCHDIGKPLLLYYGLLSYSKAIILFQNSSARECSLKGSHGLSTIGWESLLSNGNISSLLELKVKVTDGTFSELNKSLPSTSYHFISLSKILSQNKKSYYLRKNGTNVAKAEITITFMDVLTRLPETAWQVNKTMNIAPSILKSNLISLNSYSIEDPNGLLTSPESVKDFFGLNYTPISVKRLGENCVVSINEQELENIAEMLPFNISDSAYGGYYSRPIKIGDECIYLTHAELLFLASYFLGMISRYFPTAWMNLTTRNKGSKLFPVFKNMLNDIPISFSKHLVSRLEVAQPYDSNEPVSIYEQTNELGMI